MIFNKFLLLCFFVLAGTSTCFARLMPVQEITRTIIRGEIKNYKKYSKTKIVKLERSIYDQDDPAREAKVRPDGTFEIKFIQFERQKYILTPFPNTHIYTNPGDTLLITIDLDQAANTTFKGKTYHENLLLNQFFREGVFNPGNTYLYNSNKYSPMEFLSQMDELNFQNQKNLKLFLANNQTPEDQIDLLEALMLRKNYQTLLEYGMKRFRELNNAPILKPAAQEELVQYFDVVSNKFKNDIDLIASHISVIELMDQYLLYIKEAKLGMDSRTIIDKGNILFFMNLINESIESPELKNQLLYRMNVIYMEYDPGNFERNQDKLLSIIPSKNICNKLARYWQFLKYEKAHIQPLENYHLEDVLVDEQLQKAIEEAEGKTIYLDFWATWCAPCIEDMKKSKEAVAEAEASGNIEVIYVCVDDNESARKNFINTHQIPGKHITIAGNARAKIMSNLGNTALPFQVIISPSGDIIAKGNQYRITTPVTQNILYYSRP